MIDYIDFFTKKWLFLFIFATSGLVFSVLVSMIMDMLYKSANLLTMSAYRKWHDNFVQPLKFYLFVAVLALLVVAVLGYFIYYLTGELKNVW